MLNVRFMIIYLTLIGYTFAGTEYHYGSRDFSLVNPVETRNIIGNYAILGNTSECVTTDRINFGAPCEHNDLRKNDNGYMVKYIDIDSDSKTWNSTSSNFTLPSSAIEDINGSIVWVGLFWQGNINNYSRFNFRNISVDYRSNQRRAYLEANEIKYINLPYYTVSAVNLENTDANKVLLKVDNGEYESVEANLVDIFKLYGVWHFATNGGIYYVAGEAGGSYAAYADITDLIVSKRLKKGKHTITVANITANEGREPSTGDFAGWSMIVIYKEGFGGKPRNISIFSGYAPVSAVHNSKYSLSIKGFRLPKSGDVSAQYSVFAGEGEWLYGSPASRYDTMTIGKTENGPQEQMPNVDDPTNIFDARLTSNIKRDTIGDNNLLNNNGIDIDSYDVSSIMTKYRDENKNINEVFISLGSNQDYFTPSMLAFSAQLYAPKVCYDYDLKLNRYIDIASSNRFFSIDDIENEPLQIKIMLRSQEADFDLIESKLYTTFNPSNIFKYQKGSAKYSPPNTYTYLDAIETDINKGEIAIGRNPTTKGGTIGAKETTYAKLYYKFLKPSFTGKFDIVLDSKISFDGINKVPYQMSTSLASNSIFYIGRCDINPIYNPIYGTFNVERGDSTFSQKNEAKRYSLYTQVVGVPYSVSVASYGKDSSGKYTKARSSNAVIELELIDGGTFENNSSAGYDSICDDPDTYNGGVFVKFKGRSRVKVNIPDQYPNYPKDLALKNAIFRTWTLTKEYNGTKVIVNHNCNNQNDSQCFDALYQKEYKYAEDSKSKFCLSKCTNSNRSECYDCLREHFAIPICSRDNFAIRPSSYSIAIKDSNQTNGVASVSIGINDSNSENKLSAGYLYRLETNATKFNTRDNVKGYYFISDYNSSLKESLALFNDLNSCPDLNNTFLDISILNGKSRSYGYLDNNSSVGKNTLIINNSGKYKIHLKDAEWTEVDHKGYKYKPFPKESDCVDGSSAQFDSNLYAKRGCVTQTGDSNSYPDFPLSMHPYKFLLDSIRLSSNPNSASEYIYINDLNSTATRIPNGSVMALKIAGDIVAVGKNNKELSNYINGCSAQELTVSLDYNKTPANIKDTFNKNLVLIYALYDSSAGDNSVSVVEEHNTTNVELKFAQKYFYTPSRGHFNSYFNIKRAFNNPINPFMLHFNIMDAKSPNEKISVDMQNNFIPSGSTDLNGTKTLYYAKIKSESDFYDDIYDDNVTTPIYVAVFCNSSLDYCKKYGIDTTKALTNDEYDWWLSLNHDGSSEGEAILQCDPAAKATITPAHINNFDKGIAKDVTVISLDRLQSNLPYTVFIKPHPLTIQNFPWLLYNKYGNTPPPYLYKVRFVNSPAAWSGKGKTGNTINVNSTGRKSKKVDW